MAPRRDEPPFTFRLVPLVAQLCREAKVDPLPLLAGAGLPASALAEKEVTAPLSAFRALLAEAARATADDAFGLTLAARVPDGTYSLLEFGAKSAQTLREAFVFLARFAPLVNEVTSFEFEEDARGGRFFHRARAPGPGHGRELHEFTLARVLAIARAQVGERFLPTEAWLQHPRPPGAERLAAELGPRLRFGAKRNGFQVAPEVLERPLASADPALQRWLGAQAEEALARLPGAADLSGRVRLALLDGLARGGGEMKAVAAALKVSERTLQRRLAAEGATFAGLLEEVRRALAERYLADPRLSVSEVAWRLGYSELRAFDRAFLRWYGASPNAWRKRPVTA